MRYLIAILLCVASLTGVTQAASPQAIAEARALKVRQMQAYNQEQRRLEIEREMLRDGVREEDPMLPMYWSMMMRQYMQPQGFHFGLRSMR